MKTKFFLFAAAASAMLTACSGNDQADNSPKNITIEASVGQLTRATTTGNSTVFDTGDKVMIYAWTGTAASIPAERVVNGVENTLGSDSKWSPASLMLWKDMETPHYFLGLYPSRTVSNFTADPYTLNPADFEQSDLLVARNLTGLKATDNPVPLVFDHAMALLNVNLQFRNQWLATPTVTSVVATAATSCTIDYLAKTYATGAQQSVAMPATATAAGYALSYKSIMIPQTGFRTVVITIDGQPYTYTHTADIPLEAGKFTTLNLIVGHDRIDLGTVSINDWQPGDVITGGNAI